MSVSDNSCPFWTIYVHSGQVASKIDNQFGLVIPRVRAAMLLMSAPKHASHLATTALVLGVWFMGSVCGQCFFNSTEHSRELGFADFIARNNPSRLSTKNSDEESDLLFYGYRYYNPSTGRWLSRDPVHEKGGLNLYAILDADALNYVDPLGLDKEIKPLPESAAWCCTAQAIADGEKTLNANFQKAKAAAKARGITPAPGGGAGATCKNSSQDIIDWLAPFPPCWRCHIEERNYYSTKDDPNDTRWDHQVIICTAYLPGSVKNREIIFDWWGDVHYWWKKDVSGGPPDDFRKEYRYPGKIQNPPYYTNCDGTPGYKGSPPTPCFSCSTGGTP